MRGLVMEVKKDTLVVLTAQGKYLQIKNQGTAAIGDFVPCDSPAFLPFQWFQRLPQLHWFPRHALASVMSLVLVCSAGLGAYGYSQPFGIVSIDINPSMALTYNWFEQVIAVEALNADAEKLLPALDLPSLKHKPVSEAVQKVVDAASAAGYLEPELANVVFISVSDKSSANRTNAVLSEIDQHLSEKEPQAETVLLTGTPKTYTKAKENHIPPTKELIESTLKSDSPENEPQAHNEKPLKRVLQEQKEKREKLSQPAAQEKREKDTIPGNEDRNEHRDSDRPSQRPDIRNKHDSPSDRPDPRGPQSEDADNHDEKGRESGKDSQDKPGWRNQESRDKDNSKDKD